MHYTKFIAIAALMFGTALAAPAAEAEAHPPKPAKPTPITNVNSNQCGNGAMPYCCDTDNSGKFNSCYANSGGSQCKSTTVCCNAQFSVQTCLGDATIVVAPTIFG